MKHLPGNLCPFKKLKFSKALPDYVYCCSRWCGLRPNLGQGNLGKSSRRLWNMESNYKLSSAFPPSLAGCCHPENSINFFVIHHYCPPKAGICIDSNRFRSPLLLLDYDVDDDVIERSAAFWCKTIIDCRFPRARDYIFDVLQFRVTHSRFTSGMEKICCAKLWLPHPSSATKSTTK